MFDLRRRKKINE